MRERAGGQSHHHAGPGDGTGRSEDRALGANSDIMAGRSWGGRSTSGGYRLGMCLCMRLPREPALMSSSSPGKSRRDVPVSKHHGVAEALGAGFVEPLPAAVALQHLQVPPEEGEQAGGSHHPDPSQAQTPPARKRKSGPNLLFSEVTEVGANGASWSKWRET